MRRPPLATLRPTIPQLPRIAHGAHQSVVLGVPGHRHSAPLLRLPLLLLQLQGGSLRDGCCAGCALKSGRAAQVTCLKIAQSRLAHEWTWQLMVQGSKMGLQLVMDVQGHTSHRKHI